MIRKLIMLGALVLATATVPLAARGMPPMTLAATLEGCIAFCGGSGNVQTYDASGVCICKGAAQE